MSRQQRLIYLPLVGTTFLCLLVGVCLLVRKRSAKSTPSTPITKHKAETSSDDALAYWTEDKMRKAKGLPLPETNALDQEKHLPRHRPDEV